LLALGLLAALAGPAPTAAPGKPPPLPADLALLRGAPLVVAFDVARHWGGPEAVLLKRASAAHPMILTGWARDIDKVLGVGPDGVERLVFSSPPGKEPEWVVLVTARRPFDRARVQEALTPDASERKVGGRSILVAKKGDTALAWLDDRTLLTGGLAGVRGLLERDPSRAGDALLGALGAAGKSLFVLGALPEVLAADLAKEGEAAKPFLPLFKARSWVVTADAGKELRFDIRLEFPDEASARAAVPALQATVGHVGAGLAWLEKDLEGILKVAPPRGEGAREVGKNWRDTTRAARAAVADFKAEREGPVVRGALHVKTETPVTSFVLLLSLLPRPAKKEPARKE
jgi:hypothetical protein